MGRKITVECSAPSKKLAEAKKIAAEKGVTIEDDGSVHGMGFKGSYEIKGKKITMDITNKPFFLSWDKVESEIRKFLS
ncbi:hypothetical protein GF402_11885 [Candidatus Fermentibacteria bacterium]|nr:hypothetical protein [Candidatus Fermentibacteria bacterium]